MSKKIFNTNSSIYLGYGYLMLPLNLKIVPRIKIGNETFFPKSGYHVSLLCIENFSKSDQKRIFDFAQKYSVKIKKITSVYRLALFKNQQSIIVRVHLRGLKKLISAINHYFGYNFSYPPTHITLFTLKGQYGIAINSNVKYQQLTHQIDPKDSKILTKSFKLIR